MDGAVSLDKTISLLRDENSRGFDVVGKKTEKTTESVNNLNKTVGELLEEIRGSRKDQAEKEREDKSKPEPKETPKVTAKEDPNSDFKLLLFGFAGGVLGTVKGILKLLAVIPIVLTTFATSFVTGWVLTLSQIGKLSLKILGRLSIPIVGAVRLLTNMYVGMFNLMLRAVSMLIPQQLKVFTSNVGKNVVSVFTRITKNFNRIIGNLRIAFQNGLNGISKSVRSARGTYRKMNAIEKSMRFLGKSFALINKGLTAIRTGATSVSTFISTSIGKSVQGVLNAWGRVAGGVNQVSKVTSSIGKIFSPITKTVQRVSSFIRGFGALLGKVAVFARVIAFPITVITGIIGGIRGFMKGFEERGLIAGIIGGLGGVFNAIVSVPLDLLKGALAWILDKLGFERAAEFLRSFSFEGLVNSLLGGVTDLVYNTVETIKGIFSSDNVLENLENLYKFIKDSAIKLITLPFDLIIDAIGWVAGKLGFDEFSEKLKEFSVADLLIKFSDTILETIKNIIRSVLPEKDSFLGKLVPDAVYEYLGEPPVRRSPDLTSPWSAGDLPTDGKKEELKSELEMLDGLQKQLDDTRKSLESSPDSPEKNERRLKLAEHQIQIDNERFRLQQELGMQPKDGEEVPTQRERPERPELTQRQMATAQLEVSDRERRMVERAVSVNAVDASQRIVNNNSNVSSNQTAVISPNLPAVDNLDRSWGW